MPVNIDFPVFTQPKKNKKDDAFYSDTLRDCSTIWIGKKSLKDLLVAEILRGTRKVRKYEAEADIRLAQQSKYAKKALDAVIKRELLLGLKGAEQEDALMQFKMHAYQEGPGYVASNSLKQIAQLHFFSADSSKLPSITLDSRMIWSVDDAGKISAHSIASIDEIVLRGTDNEVIPFACAFGVTTTLSFDSLKKEFEVTIPVTGTLRVKDEASDTLSCIVNGYTLAALGGAGDVDKFTDLLFDISTKIEPTAFAELACPVMEKFMNIADASNQATLVVEKVVSLLQKLDDKETSALFEKLDDNQKTALSMKMTSYLDYFDENAQLEKVLVLLPAFVGCLNDEAASTLASQLHEPVKSYLTHLERSYHAEATPTSVVKAAINVTDKVIGKAVLAAEKLEIVRDMECHLRLKNKEGLTAAASLLKENIRILETPLFPKEKSLLDKIKAILIKWGLMKVKGAEMAGNLTHDFKKALKRSCSTASAKDPVTALEVNENNFPRSGR